jgi:hypothetical protein
MRRERSVTNCGSRACGCNIMYEANETAGLLVIHLTDKFSSHTAILHKKKGERFGALFDARPTNDLVPVCGRLL